MRQRVVLGILAFGLLALYAQLLIFAIGTALALAPPPWWGSVFTNRLSAVYTWAILTHTAAILLVALPFSYVIARFYGRVAVPLALAITVVLYAVDPLPAVLSYFVGFSFRMKMVTLFDAVKLLGILPCLVWLFARLTSNNRLERSRVG